MYRMYSKADPARFHVTLVHGWPSQERYSCFASQEYLGRLPTDAWSMYRWQRQARLWLRANLSHFDVFHGIRAWEDTVRPAAYAQRHGLPAVVRPGVFLADLVDKPGWRTWVALPRRRRQAVRTLAGVIAISSDIVGEMLRYGVPPQKVLYIPNGVDIDHFRPVRHASEQQQLRQQFGWPDLPTIIFCGALVPRKRPDLLIEAMGLLKGQGREAHLVLVGPPDDRQQVAHIRDRSYALGLRGLVSVYGFTHEVAKCYRGADVFALPSEREGMPNAMLEAMASGLPCVVGAASGVRDVVVEDCHGRIVPQSPEDIAAALRVYLDNPELRADHGRNCRDLVMAKYSTSATLDAHESAFRRIMFGEQLNPV